MSNPVNAGFPPNMSTVDEIVLAALNGEHLSLLPHESEQMTNSVDLLEKWIADGRHVYGVTSGFGPLVGYPAAANTYEQGLGLIHHLCVGQGRALSPAASRLLVWLRLQGMRLGYSAMPAETWEAVAALARKGFTPVIPSEGSVSASGDLIPLAHAAQAFAGEGQAWSAGVPQPARQVIQALDAAAVRWPARAALGFVNGCSAALASAILNLLELTAQARACAALTGYIVNVLGCNPEPYGEPVHRVRGQVGQLRAARWIASELRSSDARGSDRPLQEPYSLRCAPQVIGAVLDQLSFQEQVLLREAAGCTDNPIVVEGKVWHAGNFHALPIGLAADQLSLCAHQLAFLAERQLALLMDPVHNGGCAPLLCTDPGRTSGLAGVQIAASALVARCRQLAYPATLTALPTNLNNQDHVPMALNAALAGEETVQRGWLVIGSLAVAAVQLARLSGRPPRLGVWRRLYEQVPLLDRDRPMAAEVRLAAQRVRRDWGGEALAQLAGEVHTCPTDDRQEIESP
jgi:histidine ammonia-lyase